MSNYIERKVIFIEEETYYTCRVDRAFKDIFLDPNDTSLLKALLESILKVTINTIIIHNSELQEGNVNIRRKNLDAVLETNEGIINVEINSTSKEYIRVRNFAFLAKAYSNHTLRGNSYDAKTKFIQINFTYNLKDSEYHRIYYIQDDKKKDYIKNFIIYEFNMDKYVKLWYTKDEEKIKENKYLIMMDLPKKELEAFSKEDLVVEEYMNKLNKLNENPEFKNLIDYEHDNIMMMNSMKEDAIEEGLQKGLEQGLQQGLTEGKEQGINEGIWIVAKNLLKNGMSLEDISKNTGLSLKELEKMNKKS